MIAPAGGFSPRKTMSPWCAFRLVWRIARAGLTPLEAIEAATANGPLTLGPQAPKSGLLAPGYDADVIVVARDPLQDIGVLAEPANVVKVWKGGVLVKG